MISLILLVLMQARADVTAEVIAVQQALETRMNTVVRSVDPMGMVAVTVKTKRLNAKLPMTRFEVKEMALRGFDGGIQIESLDIKLLLADLSKGAYLRGLLSGLAKSYNISPHITVSKLPDAFIKDAIASAKSGEGSSALNGSMSDGVLQGRLKDLKDQVSEQFKNEIQKQALQVKADVQDQLAKRSIATSADGKESQSNGSPLVVYGLIAFALVGFFAISRRNSNQAVAAIRDLERSIADSLQQSALAGGDSQNSVEPRSETNVTKTMTALLPEQTGSLESLPAAGLLALFSDAYWCQQDRYAAWLWQQIKPAAKQRLISESPFLIEYAKSLTHIAPEPLEFHNDLYYLSPLSLNHLNQEALFQVLRETTSLYLKLSEMRKEALPIHLEDRVRFERGGLADIDKAIAKAEQAAPSRPRRLNTLSYIPIRTVDEELKFENLEQLDLELVPRVCSWVWITYLPEASAREILEKYSARELASAWIGPESVLNRVRDLMGSAKAEMLDAYLNRVAASRKSPVFIGIHTKVVQRLVQDQRKQHEAVTHAS